MERAMFTIRHSKYGGGDVSLYVALLINLLLARKWLHPWSNCARVARGPVGEDGGYLTALPGRSQWTAQTSSAQERPRRPLNTRVMAGIPAQQQRQQQQRHRHHHARSRRRPPDQQHWYRRSSCRRRRR